MATRQTEFQGTERFEIKGELGAGSMGVVYEAIDRDTRARLALKTLHFVEPEAIARLKNEFRAVQGLRHRNLVRLGELVEDQGMCFFTMELIDGSDFVTYVRRTRMVTSAAFDKTLQPDAVVTNTSTNCDVLSGEVDETRLRSALGQLVEGLVTLHATGAIHRDIKPSNILVTDEGRVVVCDFGLATRSGSQDDSDAGKLVGTAAYMAPEQAASKRVGPAADWYSVGIIMYQSLTGRLPFEGRPLDILIRKQHQDPIPPRDINPNIPQDLAELTSHLMSRDPNQRPTGQELHALLGGQPGPAPTTLSSLGDEPFIGRDDVVAEIMQRPHGAAAFFIQGAAGLGKTALLAHLEKNLAGAGVAVFGGRCFEQENVPFKAFDELIASVVRHLRAMPNHRVARVLPGRAKLLSRLFSSFARLEAIAMSPPLGERGNAHERRSRAFDALRELFVGLAREHPVALILDDFHWADADSKLLLRALFRPPRPPPVMLIVASRPVAHDTPAHRDDETLVPGMQTIELGELGADVAHELAIRLLKRHGEDTATIAATVAHTAQGHPLYIKELVHHILLQATDEHAMPELGAAIWSRIDRLPLTAVELLELTSLAGAPVSHSVLRQASGQAIDAFMESISVLRSAQLVRSQGVRLTDRVEPYHDHVRQAVTRKLGDRASELHLRLAAAVASSGTNLDRLDLLTHHLHAGGEAQQAAHYAEEAAYRALEAFAFDRSAALFQRALELGDHTRREAEVLRLEAAKALGIAGHGREAAELYEQVADIGDPGTSLSCRMAATEQYLAHGHLDPGLRALDRVLARFGVKRQVSTGATFARLLWLRLLIRLRGLGWTPRHLSEVSALDLARVDAFAAVAVGLGLIDSVQSAEFQARGVLAALRSGEPTRVGRALFYEAVASGMRGNAGRARANRFLTEATRAMEGLDDDHLRSLAQAIRGMLCYFAGDFRHSLEFLRDGELRLREDASGPWGEINMARTFQIFCLRLMGDVEKLREAMNLYLWDADKRGDRYSGTTFRRIGYLQWLADDAPQVASRELERATWMTEKNRWHLQDYFELHANAELELYQGTAANYFTHAEPRCRAFMKSLLARMVQISRCEVLFLLGRLGLAAAKQPHSKGLAVTRQCYKRLARERTGYARVWSLLLRGCVHIHQGRNTNAVAVLTDCVGKAEKEHMYLCEAVARERLAQVLGGDEGEAHIRIATRWWELQEIRCPGKMVEMMAPTLAGRDS